MSGHIEALLGAVDKKLKESMLRLNEAIAIMNNIRTIEPFEDLEYIKQVECET